MVWKSLANNIAVGFQYVLQINTFYISIKPQYYGTYSVRVTSSLETTTLYCSYKWIFTTHIFTVRCCCCCDPFRKRTGCKVPSSRSRLNRTSGRLNCPCSDTPTAMCGGSPRRTASAKVTSHGRPLFPWSSLAVNIAVFAMPNRSVVDLWTDSAVLIVMQITYR